MKELFPDNEHKTVPKELIDRDIPEDYTLKLRTSGDVSVMKTTRKKFISVSEGIEGHTSALADQANRGFALGKGARTGSSLGGNPSKNPPPGFALSTKGKI
jgi:hypothetical protein